MSVSKMEEFIRTSSAHSAWCSMQLELIRHDMKKGSYWEEVWKCPYCSEELRLQSCDMVKTGEVAQGAAYSRCQPEFNTRMVKGASVTGINIQKAGEYTSRLGLETPTYRNWRK